jgi:hypothetical protein
MREADREPIGGVAKMHGISEHEAVWDIPGRRRARLKPVEAENARLMKRWSARIRSFEGPSVSPPCQCDVEHLTRAI